MDFFGCVIGHAKCSFKVICAEDLKVTVVKLFFFGGGGDSCVVERKYRVVILCAAICQLFE